MNNCAITRSNCGNIGAMATSPSPVLSPALSAADTSLSAAQANILAGSKAYVAWKNAQLASVYINTTWANYVLNMESGETIPPERQTPPQPPMALELAPPNADGFVFYQTGTTPVCAMPPLPYYAAGNAPIVALPNKMLIGNRIGTTAWFDALPGDGFPNGKTTPPNAVSADGVTGMFERFGGVASWGWYELLS